MTSKSIRAFVDRIEENQAVVLLGEQQECEIVIPKSYLPEEASEGSVLTLTLKFEPELTRKSLNKISEMIKRLNK